MNSLRFHSPFTCIVAGATSSGKTVWVQKLLKNWKLLLYFKSQPRRLRVLWCYGQVQSIHNNRYTDVGVEFFEGIPTIEYIESAKPHVIVLDDLMNELKRDETVKNLFTRVSHHMNISVILITQNIFSQDKSMRTISLNSHYICLMKSIRLTQQVGTLANQIWPGKGRQVMEIYKKATTKNFSYLLIDLHPQQTEDSFRIRNRIFPSELPWHISLKYHFSPIIYPIE